MVTTEIRYEDFFVGAKQEKKRTATWQEREAATRSARGKADQWDDEDFGELDDDLDEPEETFDEDAEMDDAEEPLPNKRNLLDEDDGPTGDDKALIGQTLSTFEKQQARMQKIIKELEKEAVEAKPWALKGEVSSKARPVNSLLEEDLEVEHAAKPVPVISEESTATLDSIIIRRIKDQAWDDVERKAPPKDTVFDPNRRFELLDEKNSKSLAQVYEEEYLRQTSKAAAPTEKDVALKKQHDEISGLFKSLCYDLDALSNWHYTPKAATIELEVTPLPSVPAIQMEEVTPATVSDAMLAAPKEVYDGTVAKSQAEMDASDKRKARLKAKRELAQEKKLREQARKEREAATGITNAQVSKDRAMKQLMGQKNVTIIADKSNAKQLKSGTKGKGKARDVQASVMQVGGKIGDKNTRADSASSLRL
eukprot:jgi/Hompol1/6032/HPOL_002162-RA